jgi:hypothetical protein
MATNPVKTPIYNPENFLTEHGRTLEKRLTEVRLPPGTEEIITSGQTKKLVRDKVLGLFKVGQVITAVLNWNEEVDGKIRDLKRDHLLEQYIQKSEENEQSITSLKDFLSSPAGNTLFNKIIRILDESPPDVDLIGHLSSALKHIISSDFEGLFSDHRYALAQIEQISPQALAILADVRSWPKFQLISYQSSGRKVVSDWLPEFADAYGGSKNLQERATQSRLRYSLNELSSRRIIEANLLNERLVACEVTDIGRLLLPYLDH